MALVGEVKTLVLLLRVHPCVPQDWGTTWGNVNPSTKLLEEFEPTDPRYKWTFWEDGDMVLTKAGNTGWRTTGRFY
ncbi:MAG: hypothetical protein WDN26_10320 [Chitinophagaceae bacterium]